MRIPRQVLDGLDAQLLRERVEPSAVFPVVVTVDDDDAASDVIDALALTAFTSGREPYSKATNVSNVRADALLRPADAPLLREALEDKQLVQLSSGPGWTLRVRRYLAARSAHLAVTAESAELASSVLDRALDGALDDPPPLDEAVLIGFWHLTMHGPRRMPRPITADTWSTIRGNYASSAAADLDRLMTLDRAELRGRLLLLYGPPGTGKTTALRALAREWFPWCQVDCVLDPERLFAEPGYLLHVALDDSGTAPAECDDCDDECEHGPGKYRMLLLEDCDELIRGEAKQATGQALSRLLNLTDGMLGQGRDVIVAITTNEDIARLHPAVVRPGRCLARIEVPALPPSEAAAWLGGPVSAGPSGYTLAELYALRDGETLVEPSREPVRSGQYL